MPHISLPEGLPGIRGPMAFRPETAKPINELADVLLRGPHTLSPGERELIATVVSSQNDCRYCQTIHGAIAAHHLDGNEGLVIQVKADPQHAGISDKLKALLVIAGKTAESGNKRPQSFCPECGTPVYATAVGAGPKVYSIRVGSIRQRDQIIPHAQVWSRSSQSWATQVGSIRKFEKQPPIDQTGKVSLT